MLKLGVCNDCFPFNRPVRNAVNIDYSEQKEPIFGHHSNVQSINREWVWWLDNNVDAFYAIMRYTTYSKTALNKALIKLRRAGWQMEHYEGPLSAVLIRPELPLYDDEEI